MVVLNYNGKPFLDKCFTALSRLSYPASLYEVIMVDNASTDGSVAYVQKFYPSVRILSLNRNLGYTGGNNKGAEVAKGDLIAFLNSDTSVDKDWLSELVSVLIKDERIGVCGSKIVFAESNEIQYDGGFVNLMGSVVFHPVQKRAVDGFYLVGSICGAAFLIKKKILKELGYFDEDFFMYSDESDLCLRAWLYGYRVAYVPSSVIYHYSGGSQSEFSNEKNLLTARLRSDMTIFHGNKNSLSSIIKNFEPKQIVIGTLVSFFYIFFQNLMLLKNSEPKKIKLLISASIWPIRHFRLLWKKRLIIQRKRIVSDKWLLGNGLLISMHNTLILLLRSRSNV